MNALFVCHLDGMVLTRHIMKKIEDVNMKILN